MCLVRAACPGQRFYPKTSKRGQRKRRKHIKIHEVLFSLKISSYKLTYTSINLYSLSFSSCYHESLAPKRTINLKKKNCCQLLYKPLACYNQRLKVDLKRPVHTGPCGPGSPAPAPLAGPRLRRTGIHVFRSSPGESGRAF